MSTMIDAPHVRLLLLAGETIRAVDYLEAAGVEAVVTIRHARNRKPVKSERPCITIVMVGDEPRPDDLNVNTWESVRELTFDLVADLELPPETSDDDPTGLGIISKFVGAATRALRVEGGPMLQLCDFVTPGSIDPQDEAQSDDGRLVRGMSVLYRVRTDDENVLLAAGEYP